VQRLEEGEADDVVDVVMAQKQFDVRPFAAFGKRVAESPNSGSSVEDKNVFTAADFHASGIATVL
jgi:hypothetical protein